MEDMLKLTPTKKWWQFNKTQYSRTYRAKLKKLNEENMELLKKKRLEQGIVL